MAKAKSSETRSKSARVWHTQATVTEGSPVLVADAALYANWGGAASGDDGDYQRVVIEEGAADPAEVVPFAGSAIALVDTDGGGRVDVGVTDHDVVVLPIDGDLEDDPKSLASVVARIDGKKTPEFFVGELELELGIIVADSALAGSAVPGGATEAARVGKDRLFVPRAKGRYVLLEAAIEDDRGEHRWFRLVAARPDVTYARRPAPPESDPVADVVGRMSFATPVAEARGLEAALELVALGRPDLALEACAKASVEREALAKWTRVLALAAQRDPESVNECRALVEAWLRPADSTHAASQVLLRAQMLRAVDGAAALASSDVLAALRARLVEAPEPEIFVAAGSDEGDFF